MALHTLDTIELAIKKLETESNPLRAEVQKAIIREASEHSFFYFAKYVLKMDKLTERNHKVWCEEVQDRLEFRHRFMRLKPRGSYKTTVYGVAFILWIWATKSKEVRFTYTSSSGTLVDEVSDYLQRFFDEDSLFYQVFGLKLDPKRKNTTEIINIEECGNAKGFSLVLRTAGGSTEGMHPNIIIIDDGVGRKDRESQAIRDGKERWFESLMPLLVKLNVNGLEFYHIFYIATMHHMDDLTNRLIRKNRDLPDDEKWDIDIEGVYDENGEPKFPEIPEIGTHEAINKLKRKMSDVYFACQYLNKVLGEGNHKFPKERLSFFEDCNHRLGKNFCFFDASKGKTKSDYPAVIWVNVHKGRCRVFRASEDKILLTDLIKLIAHVNKETVTVEMVFESNATLGLLESNLREAHKSIDYPINLIPIDEGRNKETRIEDMQPQLFSGFMQFSSDYETRYPELMNQLTFYPAWGHDDFPDVIEKAITHLAPLAFDSEDLFSAEGDRHFAEAPYG